MRCRMRSIRLIYLCFVNFTKGGIAQRENFSKQIFSHLPLHCSGFDHCSVGVFADGVSQSCQKHCGNSYHARALGGNRHWR